MNTLDDPLYDLIRTEEGRMKLRRLTKIHELQMRLGKPINGLDIREMNWKQISDLTSLGAIQVEVSRDVLLRVEVTHYGRYLLNRSKIISGGIV